MSMTMTDNLDPIPSINRSSIAVVSVNTAHIANDKADEDLLTTYGIPQRHNFSVASGDLLIFHHIQKTG